MAKFATEKEELWWLAGTAHGLTAAIITLNAAGLDNSSDIIQRLRENWILEHPEILSVVESL